MQYSAEHPLISIHIPKCAGSSFRVVLQNWFGDRFWRHYHSELDGSPPQKYELFEDADRKHRITDICIHGHFNRLRGNGVEDFYPDEKQIITVIRDPWELHVSTYFYVIREAEAGGPGALRDGRPHPIIKNRWSLEDFLVQYRKSFLLDFLPACITMDNYRDVIDGYFLFVGVTERLQETVDRLAGILGKDSVTVPIRNVSERFEKPTAKQSDIFYSKNRLEQLIYEYAVEKLNNS